MSTAIAEPTDQIETVADLIESLGGIPAWRIRYRPQPGSATEQDVLIALERPRKRICELVDGVLVEKPMGVRESRLAMWLGGVINDFVIPRNLGVVTGPDGSLRLLSGLVLIPDVAFIGWDRMPGRVLPDSPIPSLAPDLAVEVLSSGNTEAEMRRKRREYFAAGTRLVWLVDPTSRSIRVYSDPNAFTTLTAADTLDGGEVLPGFSLKLADWFGELDRRG